MGDRVGLNVVDGDWLKDGLCLGDGLKERVDLRKDSGSMMGSGLCTLQMF